MSSSSLSSPASSSFPSSPSRPGAAAEAGTLENVADPAASSSTDANSEAVAMALSSTSLADGSCKRSAGGSGGAGARGGGGRSPFGGGFPCPVDDGGGGVSGDKGRGMAVEKTEGVKSADAGAGSEAAAAAVVVMEVGDDGAEGLKEVSARKDQGCREALLSSGGCGGGRASAVDGMVGVVEAAATVVLDQAPKA